MVIASAERLMELRQFWRKSSKIAEMSVPAWPIPTHQTKPVMSHDQPIVLSRPHSPMPYQNVQLTAKTQRQAPRDARVKPIHHALPGIFSTGRNTSFVICA